MGSIKNTVKLALGAGLDTLGILDRSLNRAFDSKPLWFVATFHRVGPRAMEGEFNAQMCVPRDLFRRQLQFLKANFEILRAGEVAQRVLAGLPLPARLASITFDDGYLDNLEIAKPILDEMGLPWTMFVATGGLASSESFWWDRALRAFRHWDGAEIDLRPLGLAVYGEPVPLPAGGSEAIAASMVRKLWKIPHPDVLRVIEYAEARSTPPATPRARLSPGEVAALSDAGVEIGAHTVSHPNLELLDVSTVQAEMQKSRHELQEMCGKPVGGFAYPGGRLSPDVVRAASETGFDYAMSTIADVNCKAFDIHKLRRISMPTLSMPDTKRAIAGVLSHSAELRKAG